MIMVVVDEIIDLHHLVPAVFQIFQNLRQIFQNVLGVVVKQYDRAVLNVPVDPLDDLLCADILPVEAVDRPLYCLIA